MPCRFPDTEKFVIDRWHRLDRRWGEPERDEVLVSRTQILDHEIKRRVSWNDLVLREKYQMCTAAQLEDCHIGPLMHRPHPDRAHELRGLLQSICVEDDMPYPDRRPQILIAHDHTASSSVAFIEYPGWPVKPSLRVKVSCPWAMATFPRNRTFISFSSVEVNPSGFAFVSAMNSAFV